MLDEVRRVGLDGSELSDDEWLRRWREDHRGLASFGQLMGAVDSRFTRLHFAWLPYLAEEYLEANPEAISRESELLDAESISPVAFRYVGRKVAV